MPPFSKILGTPLFLINKASHILVRDFDLHLRMQKSFKIKLIQFNSILFAIKVLRFEVLIEKVIAK